MVNKNHYCNANINFKVSCVRLPENSGSIPTELSEQNFYRNKPHILG